MRQRFVEQKPSHLISAQSPLYNACKVLYESGLEDNAGLDEIKDLLFSQIESYYGPMDLKYNKKKIFQKTNDDSQG